MEMINKIKCPECGKDLNLVEVDKLGTVIGYRLEKMPDPTQYMEYTSIKRKDYCFECSQPLRKINEEVAVCDCCKIKY